MSDRMVVKKSKDLVFAQHNWELNEQRLITAMIKELKPLDDSDFKPMVMQISELEELFNVSLNSRAVSKLCDTLFSKFFKIPLYHRGESYPNLMPNGGIIGYKVELIHLFKKIKYNDKTVEFEFDSEMKPYILNLSEQFGFLKYNIENIVSFKNKYTQSFYEKFRFIFDKNEQEPQTLEMSLIELNLWLQLPYSYFEYKELNRRVLKPVKDELNTNSNLCLFYENITKNRQTEKVKFYFCDNANKEAREKIFSKEKKKAKISQAKIKRYLKKPYTYRNQLLTILAITEIKDFYSILFDDGRTSKIKNLEELFKIIDNNQIK